ncbi:MAG: hypothetical protein KatS3mg110_2148 [Pirellulaceae bacterium]|nr:MAG: hypothetical protein KatS3mg110_2148 [Pirellulaceae bacterium]
MVGFVAESVINDYAKELDFATNANIGPPGEVGGRRLSLVRITHLVMTKIRSAECNAAMFSDRACDGRRFSAFGLYGGTAVSALWVTQYAGSHRCVTILNFARSGSRQADALASAARLPTPKILHQASPSSTNAQAGSAFAPRLPFRISQHLRRSLARTASVFRYDWVNAVRQRRLLLVAGHKLTTHRYNQLVTMARRVSNQPCEQHSGVVWTPRSVRTPRRQPANRVENRAGVRLDFLVVDQIIRSGGTIPHVTKPVNHHPSPKAPVFTSSVQRASQTFSVPSVPSVANAILCVLCGYR